MQKLPRVLVDIVDEFNAERALTKSSQGSNLIFRSNMTRAATYNLIKQHAVSTMELIHITVAYVFDKRRNEILIYTWFGSIRCHYLR
jgi:hypothetical protein